MIQFEENKQEYTFKVEVIGCSETYIKTIKAMLFFMYNYNTRAGDCPEETYHMCNLIEGMLPDANQIINVSDIELFKEFKKQLKK